MEASNIIATISYGFGLAGMGGAIISFLRFNNYKETVKLQNDNIKALQDQAEILKSELEASKNDNAEAMGAIKRLQGNLDAYKEIPLKEISLSLAQLATSNQDILSTLKSSAAIAASLASDGGLLVKTKEGHAATVSIEK